MQAAFGCGKSISLGDGRVRYSKWPNRGMRGGIYKFLWVELCLVIGLRIEEFFSKFLERPIALL